jgi:hypothetical protein
MSLAVFALVTFIAGSDPVNAPIQLIPTNVIIGNSGLVVEQDVQYSNTNTFQVVGNIKDTNGTVFNSVSNAGWYHYYTPDGRAYQFQIPAPAARKTFVSFVPGSLANHLVTNELGLAAQSGASYSNYINRINGIIPWTFQPTNVLANLNTNFWLKNINGVQSESVGYGPGGGGMTNVIGSYFAAVVISPNAVLGTMDSGFATNTMICFVDLNGNLITRLITSSTYNDVLTNGSGANLLIGENAIIYTLDSDLPPSIPPVYFFPTNIFGKLPIWTHNYAPMSTDIICHNQYMQFIPCGLSAVQNTLISVISQGYWITNTTYNPVGGDSGNMIGEVVGTNFVLMSQYHSAVSGQNFMGTDTYAGTSQFQNIQNVMQYQERLMGIPVYQLQTIDLSAYKNY